MTHEKILMRKWLKNMMYDGAIYEDLTVRDAMGLKSKFDFYLFYHGRTVVPGDAKKQQGGLNFSLKSWKNGPQAHQFRNLIRFRCFGFHPIVLLFHRPKQAKGEWIPHVLFIEEFHVGEDYALIEEMPTIRTLKELEDAICQAPMKK